MIPYMYRQADMGIDEESIRFENGTSYPDHELQEEHADFADIWLGNIKDQGF
ncbi:DUF6908 domain-containing protein [Pedobacter sp. MW01-1-1]|uniref:DUF6908 domain-containing protein n=1 Tax=Pedobacter sp. MW01-1-1 TaxID=3383027 RepID=UPI003FEF9710